MSALQLLELPKTRRAMLENVKLGFTRKLSLEKKRVELWGHLVQLVSLRD